MALFQFEIFEHYPLIQSHFSAFEYQLKIYQYFVFYYQFKAKLILQYIRHQLIVFLKVLFQFVKFQDFLEFQLYF